VLFDALKFGITYGSSTDTVVAFPQLLQPYATIKIKLFPSYPILYILSLPTFHRH